MSDFVIGGDKLTCRIVERCDMNFFSKTMCCPCHKRPPHIMLGLSKPIIFNFLYYFKWAETHAIGLYFYVRGWGGGALL